MMAGGTVALMGLMSVGMRVGMRVGMMEWRKE